MEKKMVRMQTSRASVRALEALTRPFKNRLSHSPALTFLGRKGFWTEGVRLLRVL